MEQKLASLAKKFSDPKNLAEFIQQPAVVIAETITGILASDLTHQKIIIGRVIQSVFKLNLLTQLGREFKELRENGKIKEDYFATHTQQSTLIELLKFIDEEIPDEELFKAMKSIFFTSISKNASEKDSLLGYQFLQICKQLKSGDILVLKTCYKILKEGKKENTEISDVGNFVRVCSVYSGLPHGMIELYEDSLIRLKLLSGRILKDKSGVRCSENFRLTDLGLKLCEFITKY